MNSLLSLSKASTTTRDSVNVRTKAANEIGARQSLENTLKELLFTFRKVMNVAPRMFVIQHTIPTAFRKKLSCSGTSELSDPRLSLTADCFWFNPVAKISVSAAFK